ncbi:hypothetical protein P280DRAFT_518780 [Massarina eburnea CBS 473.64]|uniref:Uncharacterized protein n=1 Tax=Massarina eburnea CBS 473.64 TaxID=1395130 RepID=A0A6A6RXS8_9PLEO|nr:hypothetical protein P280DRAFT_518780 [Massarina eburnea CBS 473.64]
MLDATGEPEVDDDGSEDPLTLLKTLDAVEEPIGTEAEDKLVADWLTLPKMLLLLVVGPPLEVDISLDADEGGTPDEGFANEGDALGLAAEVVVPVPVFVAVIVEGAPNEEGATGKDGVDPVGTDTGLDEGVPTSDDWGEGLDAVGAFVEGDPGGDVPAAEEVTGPVGAELNLDDGVLARDDPDSSVEAVGESIDDGVGKETVKLLGETYI